MPRLWMAPVRFMCRRHLLGEHHETHVFLGKLKRRHSLTGYIENGLFALSDLWPRHEALATELERRGFKHSSPFPPESVVMALGAYLESHPPSEGGLTELVSRCPDCFSVHGAS